MKRKLLVILIFISCLVHSQNTINQKLKAELDSIYKSDQILREYIDSGTSEKRKQEILKETGYDKDADFQKKKWSIMNMQDSVLGKKPALQPR